jgi:2-dehydropantoate 2-reductase
MKISIIGLGAIGGFFGAKLAHAGVDVTFVAREQSVEKIRKEGITVKSFKGDFQVRHPKVTHDYKEIVDADYVLLCVKSYHTREIAESLKAVLSEKTIIVSLQNGVENEDVLAEIFGADRVIGGVVFASASSPQTAVIKHTAYGNLVIGELDGKITEKSEALQKVLMNSGVPTKISTDIKKDLWKKLILNISYNGFTSITGKPLEKYFEIPEAQECFIEAMNEARMVAQKEGYNITDKDMDDLIRVTHSEGFTSFKTSTLQDMEAGKQLEIDSLQGAILRTAKKHGIEVPINKLLYALLKLKY